MSFEQSISEGGLVVNTSGGNYSGGGIKEDLFTKVPGSFTVSSYIGSEQWIGGLIIVLLIMVVVFFMWGTISTAVGLSSGFENKNILTSGRHGMRFAGSNSQVGLGTHAVSGQASRPVEYAQQLKSGFLAPREAPYFPDVTNRVLRMENREKEAVRALGKINQERLRRAAEDTSSTAPLQWGPFWKEWKQTHVIDGEDVVSGFESNFERQMNDMPVY